MFRSIKADFSWIEPLFGIRGSLKIHDMPRRTDRDAFFGSGEGPGAEFRFLSDFLLFLLAGVFHHQLNAVFSAIAVIVIAAVPGLR